MSQPDQKSIAGSFTITVDPASTGNSSLPNLQHAVECTAAEKSQDPTYITDLDIIEYIKSLGSETDGGMSDYQIGWQRPPSAAVINKSGPLSEIEEVSTDLENTPSVTIGDALSDVAPFHGWNDLEGTHKIADVEQQGLHADESTPCTAKGWRWALIVSAILSSLFLFALDNTIVADIQPAIVETFDEVGKLSWLGVALLLGAASTNLIWAQIYGKFNAKWAYILSLILFEGGSALCGGSNSMSALIVGRAICGVGGVGLYIGVMTLLSLTTSIQERPNYIASTGIVWALGTVLGPVVGGALADSAATWRWAFYINLCLGGAFAPVYLLLLPSIDPTPGKNPLHRLGEMDILGGILLISAFVSGIIAISFGGTLYLWNSAQIIGCFLVSGASLALLGLQQAFAFLTTKDCRIFPVEFLKSRTMVLLFCSMSCASTGLFVPIYMVPLFFQFTRTDTALDAALRLLPFVLISVFACVVNGAILGKYGYYMPWYFAAGVFTTIGAILMSTVDENTSTTQIYGSTIVLGFGVGLVLQASFSVAQAKVPATKISDAVGFITCAQVSSLTISLAIANSIFMNGAQNRIREIFPDIPLSTIQGAIAGVGSRFVATLPNKTRGLVLKAIVQSMDKVYILSISAGIFLILLSLGMRRERLYLNVVTIS